MIYRQYEDPHELEEQLKELKERHELLHAEAVQEGELSSKWEEWSDLGQEIAELEERVNFAWQDDEYEEDCRREAYRLGEIEPEDPQFL